MKWDSMGTPRRSSISSKRSVCMNAHRRLERSSVGSLEREIANDQIEIRVWPPYSNEHVDITLDNSTEISKANASYITKRNNNTRLNILTP